MGCTAGNDCLSGDCSNNMMTYLIDHGLDGGVSEELPKVALTVVANPNSPEPAKPHNHQTYILLLPLLCSALLLLCSAILLLALLLLHVLRMSDARKGWDSQGCIQTMMHDDTYLPSV